MKTTLISGLIVAVGLLWFEAAAQKVKKVAYDFPEAMTAPVREGYRKICDKGQILYNINCAKCHTVTINGKSMIPDFSQVQLVGYELRVLNPKHASDLPETNVSAEELSQILTFLTYKQKNPPAKP